MENLYSIEKILVYVGDDMDQCKEMLELFIKTIPSELIKLELEIESKNWDKAYEITHRIKPSYDVLLIYEATTLFDKLHTKLHQQIDIETIEPQFKIIKKRTYEAIGQIKSDYKL